MECIEAHRHLKECFGSGSGHEEGKKESRPEVFGEGRRMDCGEVEEIGLDTGHLRR
jgi:hypothetical protein